jgi:Methyltransferase domain
VDVVAVALARRADQVYLARESRNFGIWTVVSIRQYGAALPVLDEAAEVQFAQAWATYSKLVDHDYVFHREVYAILHRILAEEMAGPFRFLDLACGDARGVVGALAGTRIAHYHGVDLSRPALDLAAVALEALSCPIELDQGDFVAAMADRPEPADVVWIGLSLHHLESPDKQVILRATLGALGGTGVMLVYEPTCREGESRAAYLERFVATNRPLWTALDEVEWAQIEDHVTRCDLPETSSAWQQLARSAGFTRTEELFTAPTDLYRMFRFRP